MSTKTPAEMSVDDTTLYRTIHMWYKIPNENGNCAILIRYQTPDENCTAEKHGPVCDARFVANLLLTFYR